MRAGVPLAATWLAVASPALAGPAADPGSATVVLAARSIGSRRGDPLDPCAHAALLLRMAGRPGGLIVQRGKEPAPGRILGSRHRVVG